MFFYLFSLVLFLVNHQLSVSMGVIKIQTDWSTHRSSGAEQLKGLNLLFKHRRVRLDLFVLAFADHPVLHILTKQTGDTCVEQNFHRGRQITPEREREKHFHDDDSLEKKKKREKLKNSGVGFH